MVRVNVMNISFLRLHATAAVARAIPLVLLLGFASPLVEAADDDIDGPARIVGTSATSRPLSIAIPVLASRGVPAKLMSQTSSTASIATVGAGAADIALSIRPLAVEDQSMYPKHRYEQVPLARQALAFAVSRKVWEGGVKSVSKEQLRQICEGKVTNWKEVGGNDDVIKLYKPLEGSGRWEYFTSWLYGDSRYVPTMPEYETVSDSNSARMALDFSSNGATVLPPQFVDGREVFALSIKGDEGEAIAPTVENIRSETYPICRSYFMITMGRASGNAKKVIDFMLSPEGAEIIKKSDLYPYE